LAKDSTLKFIVENVNEKEISFLSKSDGCLLLNNGFHIKKIYEKLPFLFQKDNDLIELSNKYKISYIGLSFVRNDDDVDEAKKLIDSDIKLISKIETRLAVDNINNILKKVDYILIDRGDLSADIGLEKLPAYQRFIIEKANFHNKKIFLATQFLKNMEDKPIPTIAEVIDMYNSFKMGIYGIQLSEETAIGKYPRECLEMIKTIIKEIDLEIK
jgi:pyruvate kinase